MQYCCSLFLQKRREKVFRSDTIVSASIVNIILTMNIRFVLASFLRSFLKKITSFCRSQITKYTGFSIDKLEIGYNSLYVHKIKGCNLVIEKARVFYDLSVCIVGLKIKIFPESHLEKTQTRRKNFFSTEVLSGFLNISISDLSLESPLFPGMNFFLPSLYCDGYKLTIFDKINVIMPGCKVGIKSSCILASIRYCFENRKFNFFVYPVVVSVYNDHNNNNNNNNNNNDNDNNSSLVDFFSKLTCINFEKTAFAPFRYEIKLSQGLVVFQSQKFGISVGDLYIDFNKDKHNFVLKTMEIGSIKVNDKTYDPPNENFRTIKWHDGLGACLRTLFWKLLNLRPGIYQKKSSKNLVYQFTETWIKGGNNSHKPAVHSNLNGNGVNMGIGNWWVIYDLKSKLVMKSLKSEKFQFDKLCKFITLYMQVLERVEIEEIKIYNLLIIKNCIITTSFFMMDLNSDIIAQNIKGKFSKSGIISIENPLFLNLRDTSLFAKNQAWDSVAPNDIFELGSFIRLDLNFTKKLTLLLSENIEVSVNQLFLSAHCGNYIIKFQQLRFVKEGESLLNTCASLVSYKPDNLVIENLILNCHPDLIGFIPRTPIFLPGPQTHTIQSFSFYNLSLTIPPFTLTSAKWIKTPNENRILGVDIKCLFEGETILGKCVEFDLQNFRNLHIGKTSVNLDLKWVDNLLQFCTKLPFPHIILPTNIVPRKTVLNKKDLYSRVSFDQFVPILVDSNPTNYQSSLPSTPCTVWANEPHEEEVNGDDLETRTLTLPALTVTISYRGQKLEAVFSNARLQYRNSFLVLTLEDWRIRDMVKWKDWALEIGNLNLGLSELRIEFCPQPVWITLHQETFVFLVSCLEHLATNFIARDKRGVVSVSECKIGGTSVRLEYLGSEVRLVEAFRGEIVDLLSLMGYIWNPLVLEFTPLIIRDVTGISDILLQLLHQFTQNIQSRDGALRFLGKTKSGQITSQIISDICKVFHSPFNEFRRSSIQSDFTSLLKLLSFQCLEALKGMTKPGAIIEEPPENSFSLEDDEDENEEDWVLAKKGTSQFYQPRTIVEGAQIGLKVFTSVLRSPIKTQYPQYSIVSLLILLLIRPIIGVSRGVHVTLQGLSNQLEPEELMTHESKYRAPDVFTKKKKDEA